MAGLDRDGHPHRAEGPGQQVKVIIAGGRTITDPELVHMAMSKFTEGGRWPSEIVSGGANGVDFMGEKWARDHHIPVKLYPAQWGKHGKAAGPIRNKEMAFYADELVAIWSGSPGTANMIGHMRKLGKPVHIWHVK